MKPFASCVFVALLSGALASPAAPAAAVAKWSQFKAAHNKEHGPHQEAARMARFLENDAHIEAHNARFASGLESFSLQHGQYSDLSAEEFRASALGLTPACNASDIPFSQAPVMPNGPESFDWRDKGVMTPVTNQLYCGSCYAFAGAGALEAYLKWKTGKAYDTSEQDVVDCSYRKFMGGSMNNGCQGGWPTAVYDHYNAQDIVDESKYPYVSGQSQTHYACKNIRRDATVVKGKLSVKNVRVRTEDEMASLLMSKGPFVVTLAADNQWKRFFDNLGEGVFDMDSAVGLTPNHAVVLTGFGVYQGKPYWLIKNSWGNTWATGGYGKIRRGRNMCGITTYGVFYVEQ